MKVFLTTGPDGKELDRVLQKHGDLILVLRRIDPDVQVHGLLLSIHGKLFEIDYDELEPDGQSEFVEVLLEPRVFH